MIHLQSCSHFPVSQESCEVGWDQSSAQPMEGGHSTPVFTVPSIFSWRSKLQKTEVSSFISMLAPFRGCCTFSLNPSLNVSAALPLNLQPRHQVQISLLHSMSFCLKQCFPLTELLPIKLLCELWLLYNPWHMSKYSIVARISCFC